MTYGFRPENWPDFQAELQKRRISAGDLEKVEMRPTEDPGAVLEDRHGIVDITVTLRSGRIMESTSRGDRLTLLTNLEDFVHDHRPHGPPTPPRPAWNGYLLTVACPCGVVFGRWVTPEDAELDLFRAAGLN